MAKVAVVCPAGTVIVGGNPTVAVLLDSVTTSPELKAGPLRVKVPIAPFPPRTLFGVIDNPVIVAGLTVTVAVAERPPNTPVMVATDCELTANVCATKLACVLPAATVTDAGTVTLEALLERVTIFPEDPAGSDNVTRPVEVFPPVSTLGLKLIDAKGRGLIVNWAVLLVPFKVAVIVATVGVVTLRVFIEKVA